MYSLDGYYLEGAKKDLFELTELMCVVCQKLEEKDPKFLQTNPKLSKWWATHKEYIEWDKQAELDEKRDKARAKKLMSKAWDKLTSEEKDFLRDGDYLE